MASQTPDMKDVTDRLEKVERQSRLLKGLVIVALLLGGTALVLRTPRRDRLAMAALSLAAATLVLGPGHGLLAKALGLERTVESERFVLRDTGGKTRGSWEASGGKTVFQLCDANNKAGVLIGTHEGGASLWLLGSSGIPRAWLEVNEEARLWLLDSKGKRISIEP